MIMTGITNGTGHVSNERVHIVKDGYIQAGFTLSFSNGQSIGTYGGAIGDYIQLTSSASLLFDVDTDNFKAIIIEYETEGNGITCKFGDITLFEKGSVAAFYSSKTARKISGVGTFELSVSGEQHSKIYNIYLI